MKLPPAFKKNDPFVYAVVEAIKGSGFKYKYDIKNDVFCLKRVLPAGTVFPFNFGFIPHTMAEDGDPLDIAVLLEHPAAIGSLIECRCLGVMKIEQKDEDGKKYRNDRIIAVAQHSHLYAPAKKLEDLDEAMLNEFICFFKYTSHFAGKRFELLGISDQEAANRTIIECSRKAKKQTH